ncbi:GNAT family N-acetyltransferase [Flammeovirgaceae bacterium SG7u.111]|nr:GNAT family N-acetyltransferase [Flammeovirgaceae bacterium SG7u.132]WPO35018.1 GNAT family N-acetyltransferase [Flammeovirgaceae bacterium SG7u.111]
MKDEEIEKYIDLLNKKTYAETIFIRQISEFVDVAKVWDSFPEVTDLVNNESPSMDFFFIRNERGSYIGAVYVMMNDLHWYIQQAFRKKGYLTKALKKAIIPYLFDVKCKKEIVVTIPPHNEPSKKVALGICMKIEAKSFQRIELKF